jgi:hypothetical protein
MPNVTLFSFQSAHLSHGTRNGCSGAFYIAASSSPRSVFLLFIYFEVIHPAFICFLLLLGLSPARVPLQHDVKLDVFRQCQRKLLFYVFFPPCHSAEGRHKFGCFFSKKYREREEGSEAAATI